VGRTHETPPVSRLGNLTQRHGWADCALSERALCGVNGYWKVGMYHVSSSGFLAIYLGSRADRRYLPVGTTLLTTVLDWLYKQYWPSSGLHLNCRGTRRHQKRQAWAIAARQSRLTPDTLLLRSWQAANLHGTHGRLDTRISVPRSELGLSFAEIAASVNGPGELDG
jgi:hypothetical protein